MRGIEIKHIKIARFFLQWFSPPAPLLQSQNRSKRYKTTFYSVFLWIISQKKSKLLNVLETYSHTS